MSSSFSNQVLAQIELWQNREKYGREVHVPAQAPGREGWPGFIWTSWEPSSPKLTPEQAEYIGVDIDGSLQAGSLSLLRRSHGSCPAPPCRKILTPRHDSSAPGSKPRPRGACSQFRSRSKSALRTIDDDLGTAPVSFGPAVKRKACFIPLPERGPVIERISVLRVSSHRSATRRGGHSGTGGAGRHGARITATSFVNHYNWGDFGGNPGNMMERWFDLQSLSRQLGDEAAHDPSAQAVPGPFAVEGLPGRGRRGPRPGFGKESDRRHLVPRRGA